MNVTSIRWAEAAAWDQGPVLSGRYTTHPVKGSLRKVMVFVDESGDRNVSPNRSSDFFTMTAVLVSAEHQQDLRLVIAGMRSVVKTTNGLHWRDHLKAAHDDRRQLLVRYLAAVPTVQVIHVIMDKKLFTPGSHLAAGGDDLYNYTLRFLIERIAIAALHWPGGERVADVRFGLVKGIDHKRTQSYLHHIAVREPGEWDNLLWPQHWHATGLWDGLQAADMYSGMLNAAIAQDDPRWMMATRHQLHEVNAH
jgi:hypothetical protein